MTKAKLFLTKGTHGKSNSCVADQADHADKAGQVQIKRNKCRTSGPCRRNADHRTLFIILKWQNSINVSYIIWANHRTLFIKIR